MPEDPRVHPEAGRAPFRGDPWAWREPSHGEHYRTCSFCGSIHPGDLAAEPLWAAHWADRKYGWPHKFYVDVSNRDPERLFAMGGTSKFTEADRGRYVPFEDLTEEQTAIMARDGWSSWGPGSGIYFGTRPVHHAKFYTVHLADPAVTDADRTVIEARSGLRFTFLGDGRVSWQPAPNDH